MINFFDHILFDSNSPKSDKIIILFFSLIYGILGTDFLFWMQSFEHIIKVLMGIASGAIGAVVIKMTLKYYELYWEDKIFKKKKDAKKEKDNQRAA